MILMDNTTTNIRNLGGKRMSVNPLLKGDRVVMHTCIEAEANDGKVWICDCNEFKLHPKHAYTVVMLEGFSGSFQTEYLQKINI